MLSNIVTNALAAIFLFTSLAACSSASTDGASSTSQAVSADDDASRCSSDDECGSGHYCAPSGEACGRGTCATSPEFCPMIDNPVCGCDGNTYMNSCWATMSQTGQPGTTSSGNMFVAPTTSTLTGTWSRVSGRGEDETVETLVLGSDSTYRLTESKGCRRHSSACLKSESAGTFSMSLVGIMFAPASSSNADSLATEFYLENSCPIGGPLQLVGAEPPVGGPMVSLTQD